MNWKEEATEKLRRYDAVRRAVINIPQEMARLKAEYTAVGSGMPELLPGGDGIRNKEDWLMSNVVFRQELQQSLEQSVQWLEITNRALEVLNPEERLVLHQLYMYPQGDSLEQLCRKLGVEKSSIYRRRDRALHKFTVALYGMAESN